MITVLKLTKMMLVVMMMVSILMVDNTNGATSKPHIIYILADDLGWNDVSWNNADVQTPEMEKLASEGVTLDQSYVHPICSPTRSALLTGKYASRIGRQHSAIEYNEPVGLTLDAKLLPEALKDVGYETHVVGKWHLGFCSWEYTPTYRGFDSFYGFYNGGEDHYTHEMAYKPTPTSERMKYLDLRNNTKPDPNKNGVYSTDLFASAVEELLKYRTASTPMFLYVPFQSVHAPLTVPDSYLEKYSHISDVDRRTYLGMVTALDDAVGRIVQALKDTGHYENSVLVFSSDNGGTSEQGGNNWPLRGMKGSLYEGGTRGPAFVHSPLLPAAVTGTVSNKLIHVTDWYKTFVTLAGGTTPNDIDGLDQWNAISTNDASPRTKMVYNMDSTNNVKASVRIGNYKLIVGNAGVDGWTLPPESTASASTNTQGSESVTWSSLRGPTSIDRAWLLANPNVKTYLTARSSIMLFNVEDDPEEKINLAKTSITELKELIQFLVEEFETRYVAADIKAVVTAVNPALFENVWSPGWCEAK